MEKHKLPHHTTILLLVFLDHIGIGLIIPLINPLMKDLGAQQLQQGLISSTYGILQLIGSPFMGLVSDRRGRRYVLLISYAGTATGYLILGFSKSLEMLMVSRVITGLLKHSSNAMRAYISDHSTRANRSVELGRMATAAGLGMMIGPTLSSFLFRWGGYGLPSAVSATLFVVNVCIILSRLPSDAPAFKSAGRVAWYHSMFPQVSILLRPRVAALFLVRFTLGVGVQTFRQGFSMLLLYGFNLSVHWNGLFISYQGLLTSMVQGLAIKPLSNRYSDAALIPRALALLGLSYAAAGVVPNAAVLALVLAPLSFAAGVARTTFTSVITSSVPPLEVGQVLGLADAVMSVCRILGPTLAGYFSQTFGPSSPAILSGALVGLASFFFVTLRITGTPVTAPPTSPPFAKPRALEMAEERRPLLSPLKSSNPPSPSHSSRSSHSKANTALMDGSSISAAEANEGSMFATPHSLQMRKMSVV